MLKLTCGDGSGEDGLVEWNGPEGDVVQNYQPTVCEKTGPASCRRSIYRTKAGSPCRTMVGKAIHLSRSRGWMAAAVSSSPKCGRRWAGLIRQVDFRGGPTSGTWWQRGRLRGRIILGDVMGSASFQTYKVALFYWSLQRVKGLNSRRSRTFFPMSMTTPWFKVILTGRMSVFGGPRQCGSLGFDTGRRFSI